MYRTKIKELIQCKLGVYRKYIVFVLLLLSSQLCSCQNRNSPNLSEQRLIELMNDSTIFPRLELRNPDDEIPAGVRYSEIRAIDPSAPPAIIDIVGNLNNKKTFKLSDIASSVRYVILQQPPHTKNYVILGFTSDDEHIFISTIHGLFCYSAEGHYLYTLKHQREYTGTQGGIKQFIPNSGHGNIDLFDGKLVHRTIGNENQISIFDVNELDAQMRFNNQPFEVRTTDAIPKYQIPFGRFSGGGNRLFMDDHSFLHDQNGSFTSFSINGDTICKFNDYIPRIFVSPATYIGFSSNIYRINGQVTLVRGNNDTVFRITPPNRITPAFIMNWGAYKPDFNNRTTEGSLHFRDWIETPLFIFIRYIEGRDTPAHGEQRSAKDHWAIYDKTAKTLTHHITSVKPIITGNVLMIPPLIENDIHPVGMPFWPHGINHRDEMFMIFSKDQIEYYITTGNYQNDKLQDIYNNMPDDSFCIMIVK